ncbi:TadE/TadG family type IV pilus assembly protein [Thioclava indica]|uniref:Uncharacterized protein n=1 Tax=Thioclava indica TaxID=1353528 RepID=A0A074JHT8_9RHOB|nr:hypothetical protein [Thioclava indica]KEO55485.1 hypothetical protein DT23_05815 [Thioclava indica]
MTSSTPVKKHRARSGALARFRHDESGAVTIPSLLWIVFLFFILLSTIEMSVMFMKKTLLDQRVALTSRVMQLGLDGKPDEETLKNSICSNLTFLQDCRNNIAVETFSVDQTDWSSTLDGKAVNCEISKDSTDPLPPKNIEYGTGDQIMIMRVCLRVKPIIPDTPFAKAMTAAWPWGDQYALVTTTAYVNEPRSGDDS